MRLLTRVYDILAVHELKTTVCFAWLVVIYSFYKCFGVILTLPVVKKMKAVLATASGSLDRAATGKSAL